LKPEIANLLQPILVQQSEKATIPLLTNPPPHSLYVQKGINPFNTVRKHPMLSRPRLAQALSSVAISACLCATVAVAQSQAASAHPAAPARPAAAALPPAAPISDKELAETQKQLIDLLRLSPTLTTVVAHDPSLLANQDYVARNNPQLAQFLAAHPEVARNPDFYLFTHVHPQDGSPDEALERAVWPQFQQQQQSGWSSGEAFAPITAMLAFACFLWAVVWLVRQFLENRRWSRIFKLQSEVHGRLIDKFSSTQELAAYMGTEAGRRFLEAAPIPVGIEPEQRVPNAIARVLTPLQVGIVLVLLGVGFYLLRNIHPDAHEPMLILGTVTLMPGLGFIISAGITWVLAGRLGLMPKNTHTSLAASFDSRNEQ
jgi:negative regulator of sigma E activity